MCDSASEYSDLLILLDDYSQAHVNGSQNLKKSFWGLYKARRHKGGHNVIGGGGSVNFTNNNNKTRNENSSTTRKKNKYTSTSKSIYYSPHDLVREEFSATARILDNCDDDNSNNAISSFELFDTFEYENKNTGDSGNTTTPSDSGIGLGLRQRKGKKKNTPEDDENKGTTHHQEEKNESHEIEKQKLNPIHVLFGEPLPPRDLRLAQTQAIQSLEGYVKAANRLQQIGLILDKLEKQKQGETGKE